MEAHFHHIKKKVEKFTDDKWDKKSELWHKSKVNYDIKSLKYIKS